MTRRFSLVLILSAAALAQEKKLRDPDVIFVPTPEEVVQQMLKTAKVHKGTSFTISDAGTAGR